MATTTTDLTEGIQNSEELLDLSNKILNSYNERAKTLKGISEEEKLYKNTISQQQKLSQHIAANAEKYIGYQIKSKDLEKQIDATADNRAKSQMAFLHIQDDITKQYQKSVRANSELIEQIEKENKLNRQQSNLVDLAKNSFQTLLSERQRGVAVTLKELATARMKLRTAQKEVSVSDELLITLKKRQEEQESIAKTSGDLLASGIKVREDQIKELTYLRENLRIRKQIEKSTGLLGAISKTVAKIPGIGQYLNADEAINEMEKLAAEIAATGDKATSFGSRIRIAGRGLSTLAKGFYENIKSPEAVFTFFISAAIKANKESVNLSKNLGYGAENADRVRAKFANIERSANNLNVTTANLSEAFNELSSATGFVTEYSADALQTQIKLTKQLGLSGDEAAGVYELSVLNGKSSEATYQSMLKGYVNTRNSLKVGVPFKAAIAEAAKVSGQLAANMGYNAEKIVSGVVATRALGTSLEQAKSQGASLLEFQSSIEDELQAELITGKQLNLEKARAAALMGDQVAVAEELAAQGMTSTEFSKMNVIAQNAYAKALGTTSNELADQLKKREVALASGKSLAQITADEADEATKRQDVQTKFNAGMEKLQSLIGNLLAGPLGSFLEMLAGGLDLINKMITPLIIIGGLFAGFNIAKQVGLGIDRAAFALKAQSMGQEAFIKREKAVGLLMEKEGLVARMAYNFQLFRQAAVEKGITGFKQLQLGVETLLLSIKESSLVLTIREAFKSIASAAMTAYESAAKIPVIGWVLGGAAAAAVIGLGTSLMSKGNDVISEGGYGKRTLLAPEGAIRLNDKDTVIAGTNLGLNNPAKPETPQTPNKTDNLTKSETPQSLTINKTYNSFTSETPQTPNKTDNLVKPETPPTLDSLMGNLTIPPISINLPKESTDSEINKSTLPITSPITQPVPINSEINQPIKPASTIQPVNPSINSTKTTQNNQPPALDLSPIVSVMNDVKSAIDYLNNKSWDVYLDSSKVGRGMVKGQTQSA
jgi:hypothetical protein